jgi:hypothetical protein
LLPSPAQIPDVIVGGNSPGVARTARQRPGSRRTRKQSRPSNPSVFLSSCVPTPIHHAAPHGLMHLA